ncbi:MAG: hypothetical protein E6I87_03950 [Chloroflexi bacterium]|nr:MAG: hypothetical protein E6I87_03950 [Chloroflexota bacterium]
MFGKRLLTLAALPLLIAIASNVALAAPAASQTITFNLGLNYQSLFGGGFNAPATLSGDISSDGQMSRLRGTLYAPLGAQRLELDPTTPTAISTQTVNFFWQEFLGCDMFGCYYRQHNATFTQQTGSGNVDIRLGTLRGSGSIAWATQGVCSSDCPPPYYGNPYPGYSRIDGAVLDNKDGGRINAWGQAPSIQ